MKSSLLALALFAAVGITAQASTESTTASQYKLPAEITMPGGEVYKHPVVVNVKPDGVTIMHDNGAAFWPYSQLPESIRKKLNYNPTKSVEYYDKMVLRQKHLLALREENKIKNQKKQMYLDIEEERNHVHALEVKIDKIKNQINWDKTKIGTAQDNTVKDQKNIDELKGSITRGITSGFFWTQTNQNNAQKIRKIGDFKTDLEKNIDDYNSWRFSEKGSHDNLAGLEKELALSKKALKYMELHWNQLKKTDTPDFEKKLNKEIYAEVNKRVDADMKKIAKLNEMRDKKQISSDEYIKRKAAILKTIQ